MCKIDYLKYKVKRRCIKEKIFILIGKTLTNNYAAKKFYVSGSRFYVNIVLFLCTVQ